MSEGGSLGPNGGDVLVAVMRAHGVEIAFGVVSIHNLPLVDAIDRELRFVPVRHEAAAEERADAALRPVEELIGNDDVERLVFFFQAPDGARREKVLDAKHLESEHVGAKVELRG